MASNDPTDTGGLFVGRRPGTAPLKYRAQPVTAGKGRRTTDKLLSALILTVETLLCLTLWGPQPAAWLWVGSQVDYKTDSVALGITVAFAGMLTTLYPHARSRAPPRPRVEARSPRSRLRAEEGRARVDLRHLARGR